MNGLGSDHRPNSLQSKQLLPDYLRCGQPAMPVSVFVIIRKMCILRRYEYCPYPGYAC